MTSISNARLGEKLVQIQVTDGRIASIAPSGSEKLQGEVVDLGGRWLFPGLWDNHVHFDQQALALRRVDL
ncbi:MAG: amidohydrolase, partial [Cryobacterium sp.]|nr:amidohydrolase [Cryobacterium sp.]